MKSKLYIYMDEGKEIVFKAFSKKDIKNYLKTTDYDILNNCWEESSFNINYYNNGKINIDLTNGG